MLGYISISKPKSSSTAEQHTQAGCRVAVVVVVVAANTQSRGGEARHETLRAALVAMRTQR